MAVEINGHEKVDYYLQPGPVNNGQSHIYRAIKLELSEDGQNGYHEFTLEFDYPSVPLRRKKENVDSIKMVDSQYGHKVTARDLASVEEKMREALMRDYDWASNPLRNKDDPLINMVLDTLILFFESPA